MATRVRSNTFRCIEQQCTAKREVFCEPMQRRAEPWMVPLRSLGLITPRKISRAWNVSSEGICGGALGVSVGVLAACTKSADADPNVDRPNRRGGQRCGIVIRLTNCLRVSSLVQTQQQVQRLGRTHQRGWKAQWSLGLSCAGRQDIEWCPMSGPFFLHIL